MREPNDVDDFCDRAKKLIKHVSPGHLFWYAVQLSTRWRKFQSLTEEREDAKDGEREEVEMK